MLDPVVLTLVVAVGVLARRAPASHACAGGRCSDRCSSAVALGLLAFPAMTYLAALLPFHEWGAGAYWAFLSRVGGLSA